MTPSLRRKLEALAERREELERLLADPGVIGDVERFRNFSREFAQLEPVAVALADEQRARADLVAAQAMRNDPELADLAERRLANAAAVTAGLVRGALERASFQDDNLHPTAAVQVQLLEHVWPALQPLLD